MQLCNCAEASVILNLQFARFNWALYGSLLGQIQGLPIVDGVRTYKIISLYFIECCDLVKLPIIAHPTLPKNKQKKKKGYKLRNVLKYTVDKYMGNKSIGMSNKSQFAQLAALICHTIRSTYHCCT